jgi:prevent-host-death family protein
MTLAGHARIPHRELRNNSSAVLRRVQQGEVVEVTNHGEVVAMLVPPGTRIAEATVKPPQDPEMLQRLLEHARPKASPESSLDILRDLRGDK